MSRASGSSESAATTLHALTATILSPYDDQLLSGTGRVAIAGPDLPLNGGAVTSFALLLHEFATNTAKYGALSTSTGRVDIECFEDEQQFVLTWTEREGPTVERREDGEGFGSLLARATVKGQLGGVIGSRKVSPSGCPSRERGSPAEEECVDTLIISGEETYVLS